MSKVIKNAVAKIIETLPAEGSREEKLAALLTEERYAHSVSTAEEAARLAPYYEVDEEKAFTAGLLHDCGKDLSQEDAKALPFPPGFEPDAEELANKALIHAPAGAALAAEVFDVNDPEILSAVRYHITGRSDPASMDFVVMAADCIEPTREFPGAEKLRELATVDPDAAVVAWVLLKVESAARDGRKPHGRSGEMLASLPVPLVALGRRYYKEILSETGG
ncbi:MAG: bis(5'-nucleosyl)-tetraphosphatase (symmetrical) YqeK [Candidatus Coatesbacteria bacterium]|nr:MAG: bis(5'-nucleosyl)-tetraphosphatase (symmetrical) YqeK [Candidatus Coatesbacteria bacterium]